MIHLANAEPNFIAVIHIIFAFAVVGNEAIKSTIEEEGTLSTAHI